MNKKSKIIVIFVISFLIVATLIGCFAFILSSLNPTSDFINGDFESIKFTVDEGSYSKETLDKLQNENIINNSTITYYYNRFITKYDFYAGTYEIPNKVNNRSVTLDEILYYLSVPTNAVQDSTTILLDEGDFAKSFASKIANAIDISDLNYSNEDEETSEIIKYWNDTDVVKSYMDDYPFLTEEIINDDAKILLEGYLFPDTYEFLTTSTIDQVTRKILDRTLEIYNEHINEFNNSKLSTHEIFTLASIIQWESGDPEDSTKVAGVFLNRMENPEVEWTGGKLQSTVTACYAFDLTKSECDHIGDSFYITEQEHAYNTYLNEGLPPGPVCCPNEIALNAALNPNQNGNYYYFVANKCEGGLVFSRTYAEHETNGYKYNVACAE